MKITMFGISNSGKTCYLCAMAKLFQDGVRQRDFKLFMNAKGDLWKNDSAVNKLNTNS